MARTNIVVKILADTKELASGLSEADGMLGRFGKSAGVALAGGVAAAGALGVKGFMDALDRDVLNGRFGDDIVGKAAEVYGNAWGDSLEEVSAAVAEAERAFGADANLEGLTEAAFAIAERFGTDVNAEMQTANELMESFGVSAEDAFDMLAVAMEDSTAEVRDELSAAVREYGDFFDQLGFSADSSLAFLEHFGEDGAMAMDKAADALKEFTIRGADMSASSVDAFEAAGLSAEDMAAKILAGGSEGQQALWDTAEALMTIEDPAEQAAAAIALFGAPLEDLGTANIPEFLDVLANGTEGLGDFAGASSALADEVGGNLSARFEAFKRQGLEKLSEFMLTNVVPAVETMFAKFQEHWPAIQATIQDVTERIAGFVREHWPAIRETIASTVERVRELVDTHWPPIREVIVAVIGEVVSFAQEHWPAIQEIVEEVMATIQALVERVTAIIQGIWERWGEEIAAVAERVWQSVQSVTETALAVIHDVFAAFRALFEGDWDAMWSAIGDAVNGVWELIKETVSLALDGLKAIITNMGPVLLRAGRGLFWKVRDGIGEALTTITEKVSGFFRDLPGNLVEWAGDLFQIGLDLFNALVDGLGEALGRLPGIIADKVLGPLDEIASKVLEVLGLSSTGAGLIEQGQAGAAGAAGADLAANAAAAAEQALLDAVVAAGGGTSGGGSVTPQVFHQGGVLTSDMGGNAPGLRHDEVLMVGQVGETVIPAGQTAGPFIENFIVKDGRDVSSEIATLRTLHGIGAI